MLTSFQPPHHCHRPPLLPKFLAIMQVLQYTGNSEHKAGKWHHSLLGVGELQDGDFGFDHLG